MPFAFVILVTFLFLCVPQLILQWDVNYILSKVHFEPLSLAQLLFWGLKF